MILGIDPGLENTGWGIINYQLSINNYQLIDCGVILTDKKDKSEIRLEKIFEELQLTR
jgi:Holliday junction resolvasome RuvABC endonuclease subunit